MSKVYALPDGLKSFRRRKILMNGYKPIKINRNTKDNEKDNIQQGKKSD